MLAFFAQDHASTEMVYAGADVTKGEAAREILAFADHWKATTGADVGLLVFDPHQPLAAGTLASLRTTQSDGDRMRPDSI